MPSSQTPRPMPKPKAPSREELKARVRAKIEAERALPASERIANVLHATHTTAQAQELLNRFRAETRDEIAAALLRTTGGAEVDDDFAIPAGEIRRILADLRAGGAR